MSRFLRLDTLVSSLRKRDPMLAHKVYFRYGRIGEVYEVKTKKMHVFLSDVRVTILIKNSLKCVKYNIYSTGDAKLNVLRYVDIFQQN